MHGLFPLRFGASPVLKLEGALVITEGLVKKSWVPPPAFDLSGREVKNLLFLVFQGMLLLHPGHIKRCLGYTLF